jgi:hypothetical protein
MAAIAASERTLDPWKAYLEWRLYRLAPIPCVPRNEDEAKKYLTLPTGLFEQQDYMAMVTGINPFSWQRFLDLQAERSIPPQYVWEKYLKDNATAINLRRRLRRVTRQSLRAQLRGELQECGRKIAQAMQDWHLPTMPELNKRGWMVPSTLMYETSCIQYDGEAQRTTNLVWLCEWLVSKGLLSYESGHRSRDEERAYFLRLVRDRVRKFKAIIPESSLIERQEFARQLPRMWRRAR